MNCQLLGMSKHQEMTNQIFNSSAGLDSFSLFFGVFFSCSHLFICAIILNSCPAPQNVGQTWHGWTLAMGPGVRMKGELSSWLPPALQHRKEALHLWLRSPTVQAVCGVHAKPQKKSLEVWMGRTLCVCMHTSLHVAIATYHTFCCYNISCQ